MGGKKRGAPATPRRYSRLEKERERQRLILVFGILTIAAVLGILAFGYYDSRIAIRTQPVARLNHQVITAQELAQKLSLVRQQGLPQNQLSQYAPILLEDMTNDELVREEALRRGFQVSPEEMEQALKESLGLKEGEEARLQEVYLQRLKELKIDDKEYRGFLEMNLLRGKLQEALASEIPEAMEQVHPFVILAKDEATAKNLLARLEAGEDFSQLARTESQDEETREKGGDLGWLPRGLQPELEAEAFNLELGKLSQPIPTSRGFYLIKVVSKETRPLEPEVREELKSKVLDIWLQEEGGKVVNMLDSKKLAWVVAEAR